MLMNTQQKLLRTVKIARETEASFKLCTDGRPACVRTQTKLREELKKGCYRSQSRVCDRGGDRAGDDVPFFFDETALLRTRHESIADGDRD